MQRIAIYARFSSDKQNPLSSQDQIAKITDTIDNIENSIIVKTYSDNAVSGMIDARPALDKMLKDAQSGLFDTVYAEALDRLSRSQSKIASIYEYLQKYNVKIITLAEQEVNELHIGLKGTMNALLIKDIKEKTQRGQVSAIKKGIVPMNNIFGYYADKNKLWHIDDSQEKIIKLIFDMHSNKNMTAKEIAYKFNTDLIKLPHKLSKRWTTQSVATIIQRELLTGWLQWGDFRYFLPNLEIIPYDAWIKCQKKKIDTIKTATKNTPLLLQNKLFCMNCRNKMIYSQNNKRKYFRCNTNLYARHAPCKHSLYIHQPTLDKEVLSNIKQQLKNTTTIKNQLNKAQENITQSQDNYLNTKDELGKKLHSPDFDLIEFEKFVRKMITNNNKTFSIKKITAFFNRKVKDYKQNQSLETLSALRLFIKEVHARRVGNVPDTSNFKYNVQLDYTAIAKLYKNL